MPRLDDGRDVTGTFTLVLGGGGIPGLAYLAGALTALDANGVDPAGAGLIIGTSAGALIGALTRSGCPPEQLSQRAIGPALLLGNTPAIRRRWRTTTELAARAAGAGWVIGRSTLRIPWPAPPPALTRRFPGALAEPCDSANIDGLPDQWPQQPMWIAALDLDRGRRVALGRHPKDRAHPFSRAVRASTAVPGIFAPVRYGHRVLVDGGVHSTTNLDLAALAEHKTVICVAPMAYDTISAPTGYQRALRTPANVALRREYRALRSAGARVLLLRPGAAQLRRYRTNFLASTGAAQLEHEAHNHTLTQLSSARAQAILAPLRG